MKNRAVIGGMVFNEPEFYLKTKRGVKLYRFTIATERKSGYIDFLPCVVREENLEKIIPGSDIKISGFITTKNYTFENKRKLDVYVYAAEFNEYVEDENYIELEGTICKNTVFRTTPSGKEICDVLMATNFKHISAYIPSIAWWENAKIMGESNVGDTFDTIGRFQSRNYTKDDKNHVAYEYCITKIDKGGKINGSEN